MTHPHTARLSLVAAVAANGVIGRGNAIPWRLPSDLKRFKSLTMGHPLVMGRKTFQSIGRALPGRENIVVSRSPFTASGADVEPNLQAALDRAFATEGEGGEVFVIGGAEVYHETLAEADRLYITEVDATPEGDAFFPAFDRAEWHELRRDPLTQAEGDSARSAFVIYDRVKPQVG